jgi:sulfide:quinone oxidoreductase
MSTVQRHSQARVLIAGARFAALEAVLALRAFAKGAVSTSVLSVEEEFIFTPAATRELFGPVPLSRWPLRDLVERAGGTLVPGALEAIDAAKQRIITTDGQLLDYDFAIIAVGGRAEPWLEAPGLTFTGPDDVPAMGRQLDDIAERVGRGEQVRLAFVVPPGVGWVIPGYELALLARRYLSEHGVGDQAQLLVVTSEDAPLGVFGQHAAETISAALAAVNIALYAGAIVRNWSDGHLQIVPDESVEADVVIALPMIHGPRVRGIPQTANGFVDANADGRVRHERRVFVAGDAGPFPVKQAGLACQQADRVAAAICRDLGIPAPTLPAWPVLRGLLWSGDGNHFLRRDLAGGRDESLGTVSIATALWWPPGKVAGRFLAPFLQDIEAHELVDVPAPGITPARRGPG